MDAACRQEYSRTFAVAVTRVPGAKIVAIVDVDSMDAIPDDVLVALATARCCATPEPEP